MTHRELTPFVTRHPEKNGADNEQNGDNEPLKRTITAVRISTKNDLNPVSRYEVKTEQHPT